MKAKSKQSPQEAARDYRWLASICRQQAVRHPETSWKWLSEAQRFEHLAATASDLGLQQPFAPSKLAKLARRSRAWATQAWTCTAAPGCDRGAKRLPFT